MITLHHAQGTAMSADIHEIQFPTFRKLKNYISSLIEIDDNETVYILTFNDRNGDLQGRHQDVFISENIFRINEYLKYVHAYINGYEVVFLQEYKSYEDAYRVALSMRENSHLCYEPEDSAQ